MTNVDILHEREQGSVLPRSGDREAVRPVDGRARDEGRVAGGNLRAGLLYQ